MASVSFDRVYGRDLAQHVGKEICLHLFDDDGFDGPLNWAVIVAITADLEVQLPNESGFGASADEIYFVRERQSEEPVRWDV
ncbi:MAG: hypothetical protein K2W82_17570 [Candidatus Obscuribacterales bacterium]|nr:hypothetical protein [Candidatus Obscuribacterales bacterium]